MASRRALGGRLSVRSFAVAAPPRRRVLAAFGLGASIAAAGLFAVLANGAAARGAFSTYASYYKTQRTALTLLPIAANAGKTRHKHRRTHLARAKKHEKVAALRHSDAVCVRLCDGYFFPLPAAAGNAASQAASCDSLCPDAPTQVYYRRGSDRIEDSVSAAGPPYSALPVALRYRSTADSTCSCHRDAVAYAPLYDTTLQRGDLIMTPAGFVMFRGPEGPKHRAGDFITLAKARLPSVRRGDLQAMERASVTADHPTLRQWFASQTPPALVARRIERRPERRIERVASRAASGDDRIRLLVWRGGAED